MIGEKELYLFLEENQIAYTKYEHQAVFTVEQADQIMLHEPGTRSKNLFICDEKKQRYFILWTPGEKRPDLRKLGKALKLGNPRFGIPEKMLEFLGITPGAVTVLGVINDTQHQVELLIDQELWAGELFQCHPLVNTATLVINRADMERFFGLTGHAIHVIDVPVREEAPKS